MPVPLVRPSFGGRDAKTPLKDVRTSAKNHPKNDISADVEMIDVSLNRSGTDGNSRARAGTTNENEVKGTALVEDAGKQKGSSEAELRVVEKED